MDSKQKTSKLLPLIYSVDTAARSLYAITNHSVNLVSESYILSRAILERSINFCYLIICNDDDFNNYLDYSKQKGFLSFFREANSKSKKLHVSRKPKQKIEPSMIPGMEEAIQKFTSARGKRITRWSNIRLEEKVEKIQENIDDFIGPLVMAALLFIYEDASEAIHGTYYGIFFPFMDLVTSPIPSKDNVDNYHRGVISTLFLLSGILMDSVIKAANYETPLPKLIHKTNNNLEYFLKCGLALNLSPTDSFLMTEIKSYNK